MLVRFNSDGSLDTSFDTDGIVTTDFNNSFDRGGYIALQPNGKIILGGNNDNGFALARYNNNGSLDTDFDADGKVTTYIGNFDTIRDIALQPNGKIILAGYTNVDNDFALVRYNNNGSLDTSFGTDGKIITDFGTDQDDLANSVAIQSDGNILVAGYRYIGGSDYDFALARYIGDPPPLFYTISGNAGIAGTTLSYTDGTPKTVTADGGGNYSLIVSNNWTGTVTPSKNLMTFTPTNRSYINVTANQISQNFSPDQIVHTISGNAGASGVALSFGDGAPPAITNSNGDYILLVPDNWSGTVTPSLASYTFSPPSRTYTNVLANQTTGQDYIATTYRIFLPLVFR